MQEIHMGNNIKQNSTKEQQWEKGRLRRGESGGTTDPSQGEAMMHLYYNCLRPYPTPSFCIIITLQTAD